MSYGLDLHELGSKLLKGGLGYRFYRGLSYMGGLIRLIERDTRGLDNNSHRDERLRLHDELCPQ